MAIVDAEAVRGAGGEAVAVLVGGDVKEFVLRAVGVLGGGEIGSWGYDLRQR